MTNTTTIVSTTTRAAAATATEPLMSPRATGAACQSVIIVCSPSESARRLARANLKAELDIAEAQAISTMNLNILMRHERRTIEPRPVKRIQIFDVEVAIPPCDARVPPRHRLGRIE